MICIQIFRYLRFNPIKKFFCIRKRWVFILIQENIVVFVIVSCLAHKSHYIYSISNIYRKYKINILLCQLHESDS